MDKEIKKPEAKAKKIMSSEAKVAWIAFTAAIVAATVMGIAGFGLHYLEQKEKREYEILQERKQAVFDALHVIDLVYSNESLNGKEPLNPQKWDIALARNAVNKMLIYCKNPQKTVNVFFKAVGLYNPNIESPPGISLKYLDEFRKEAARELGLPELKFVDPNKTWIASLAGTHEAKVSEERKK